MIKNKLLRNVFEVFEVDAETVNKYRGAKQCRDL